MVRHADPEVLVVGAGPVGLISALFLHHDGVGVEIVDMHQRTTQHSYALALHPRTLDVLAEAGVAGRLIAAGRKLTKIAYYEGFERRAEIDYSSLRCDHPYLLVVRQSTLERALQEALGHKDIKVRWNHRLQSLTTDGSSLHAEIATLDQVAAGYPVAQTEWVVAGSETIRPAFVIGADGYDSAVRRLSAIEMEERGAGQIFSIYEIEAAGELPPEARITLDPVLTSVYWPLEDGRCRFGFQIRDANAHNVSMERLEQLIAERTPWCSATPSQIYWSTYAVFEPRLTSSFGRGGIWLAGDAAHQAAPIAVHSMNSGIFEARELATRIARVLRGDAAPSLLDQFATHTRETWRHLLDPGSVRLSGGAAAAGATRPTPWVQHHASRIFGCIPASGDHLEQLLEQIGLTARLHGSPEPAS
jgi:2-polyprenyl-6-methoxyphenol hydroxylase-like FAD-dependent oxidoreductase